MHTDHSFDLFTTNVVHMSQGLVGKPTLQRSQRFKDSLVLQEIEKNVNIPFPDCWVTHNRLRTTISTENRHLPNDYYTSRCTTGKATTIRTLTRRAQLVCDSPDSLQDRTDYLNNVFSKNKYNANSGRRNNRSNANAKTQANFNSGPVTTATISYFRGTSETITCILYLTTDNHF